MASPVQFWNWTAGQLERIFATLNNKEQTK